MPCNGICHRYRAKKPQNAARYSAGQKRCQICGIYMMCEGWRCPCCNYRLRGKPRNSTYKRMYHECVGLEAAP